MADIFISYAREDTETAHRLADALDQQGWSVFWDRVIPAGWRFDDFLEEQIRTARCIIVLWSSHSVDSAWVREEAGEARRRDILVPAQLDDVVPPFGFRAIQAADLIGWAGNPQSSGFMQLLRDIQTHLGPPTVPGSRDASVERPGLLAETADGTAHYQLAPRKGAAWREAKKLVVYENDGQRPDAMLSVGKAYIRAAAENGGSASQCALGLLYLKGRNTAEAARWLRKAAEQGVEEAQHLLGSMLIVGEGVPQDYVEAYYWMRKAADKGDAVAQYLLGLMYLEGIGVPGNKAEAERWLNKAADQGHEEAQKNLRSLKRSWF